LRKRVAYVNLPDMSNQSRTAQLIEARLGEPLEEYVRRLRAEGASWHAVSLDLAGRTEVAITPETARIWWAHLPGMARGKAGAA
jgi:hypothetical protein